MKPDHEILLTIAVPTFNRPQELNNLMEVLLPQLSDEVCLTILDNCSDRSVADVLKPLLARHSAAKVQIIRNRINIGANANILRCFELCATPWIWIIGDDDELSPEALSTALTQLQDHPDCFLLNFPIDEMRKDTKLTKGMDDFIEGVDKSADIPWIASTIYKVSEIVPNLRIGYQFAFSMLPHVAMLMVSLNSEHLCFFSSDCICTRDRKDAITEQQTPIVNMALGVPTLLDLPIGMEQRRRLIRKLLITNDSPGLPLQQLTYQLLLQSVRSGNQAESLYCFDQFCRRWFYFDQSITERLEVFLYRLLLLSHPSFVGWCYRLIKRKELGKQFRQDRLARL